MARKKNPPVITMEIKSEADAQIKENQKKIDYDTKDYTLELLIDKFLKEEFFIPQYQRKYIWKDKNKNLFLESIFLGLPIPFMFLADCSDGTQEIIDGAQRMQTIVEFYQNKIRLSGMEKLTKLNGFTFSDLSEPQQRKFKNKSLRVIVLEEDTPDEARQDLFYRINTTGIKANDSEVRRGSYPGPLTTFIDECSRDETFVKLSPMTQEKADRYERFEFILRFFAYLNEYEKFGHDVNEFLDEYLKRNLHSFDRNLFKSDFDSMVDFVNTNFPYGFAKSEKARSTPRVRFEAIAVGVGLALRENPDLRIENVDWLNSDEFKDLTTSDASNNEGRLKQRVEFVKEKLLKGAE